MDIFKRAEEFNRDLLEIPRPIVPTRMSHGRKMWFNTAALEELTEFMEAATLAEEVDAVLDLMYFSAGRLYEMGVDPDPVLEAIHNANMSKIKGSLSKRPYSLGLDATKPAGWLPPNVEGIVADQPRPKLVVVGHGRHGKDTVGEMIRDTHGLTFKSSSLFCAEKVLWPLLTDEDEILRMVQCMHDREIDPFAIDRVEKDLRSVYTVYTTPLEAYADRSNHRELWFQAISMYCEPPFRLGVELLEEYDIYCGIRSKRELHALVNTGLVDAVVWVDRSEHLPPEDAASISIEPWMATHQIDNNGSLEDLQLNVDIFMENFR